MNDNYDLDDLDSDDSEGEGSSRPQEEYVANCVLSDGEEEDDEEEEEEEGRREGLTSHVDEAVQCGGDVDTTTKGGVASIEVGHAYSYDNTVFDKTSESSDTVRKVGMEFRLNDESLL